MDDMFKKLAGIIDDIYKITGDEIIRRLKLVNVDATWDRGGLIGSCPSSSDFLIVFHSGDQIELDIGIDSQEAIPGINDDSDDPISYVFHVDYEHSLRLADPELFDKIVKIILEASAPDDS